jgi:hypothetical protein
MRRTTMLWEVFVTRFQETFEQYEKHRLSGEEAGELLGMSGRHFRRLCVRYEEDGIEGLRDRRLGKVSPRRAPERELERMHELYRERYSDFTVKHFHEQLVERHDHKTLMWLAIALAFALAGPTSQAVVRTRLEPRWPVAVGLAIILSYLIVELGGEGGAEFVYFQF